MLYPTWFSTWRVIACLGLQARKNRGVLARHWVLQSSSAEMHSQHRQLQREDRWVGALGAGNSCPVWPLMPLCQLRPHRKDNPAFSPLPKKPLLPKE